MKTNNTVDEFFTNLKYTKDTEIKVYQDLNGRRHQITLIKENNLLQELIDEVTSRKDSKYPDGIFSNSETGETHYGVREETHIRMANDIDLEKIQIYEDIIQLLESKRK